MSPVGKTDFNLQTLKLKGYRKKFFLPDSSIMETLISTLLLCDTENIQPRQMKEETVAGLKSIQISSMEAGRRQALDSVKVSELIPNIQHPQQGQSCT